MDHEITLEVNGPWSLETSKRFWEEFTPAALPADGEPGVLRARFLSEHDWMPVTATVAQEGPAARIRVTGDGDLTAAAGQVARFLSLDVDARAWPEVGRRDAIIGAAQKALPGFRPCGFHSAYEAAAWSVLSQRTRVRDAARLRTRLISDLGHDGAFPAPAVLVSSPVSLPGRKSEYLAAVAEAALDGALDSVRLRALPEEDARKRLREITGIGPFVADLILIRGTNAADVLPRAERRLDEEIARLYGPEAVVGDIAEDWRPFRSWAAVHLRALREERTRELASLGPVPASFTG